MSDKRNFELEAVKLLRTSNEGVLTTISDKFEGYPFGSFITYITDRDRSVIILQVIWLSIQLILKKIQSHWLIFSIKDYENKQDNPRIR